jgi:tetratricopeptide (TPR) repeat protein
LSRGALGAGLALVLGSHLAVAQPSIWDAARDPKTVRDYQTLVAVERLLSRGEAEMVDPFAPDRFLRAAMAVIELGGGDESADPRLMFIAGDLLSDATVGRDADARKLLGRALQIAPDSPLAGRAWFNLAIASARSNDPEGEHDAYSKALERVYERGFRANIYANRGESSMVLGKLDAAIADYEKALELADRPDLQALAYFGLGIARERNGDLPGALDAMAIARRIEIPGYASALDMPSVFFVPEYDIHYYKALSEMSAARDAKNPDARARHQLAAVDEWQKYLEPAIRDRHRWVPHAKLHVDTLLKRLKQLVPTLKPLRAKDRAARGAPG